jgi:nucleotide-binding universal stress UspA family protein
MFEVIVVGTDGSLTADQAVARAAELASQTGGALHIVTAYRSNLVRKLEAERASSSEEIDRTLSVDDEARVTLRSASVLASQAGVIAETHAVEGDPARMILRTAGDVGAELIVVGSKGLERRVFGSVPNTVTHQAGCDVLVVHTT